MKAKNTPTRWYNHWMTHALFFVLIWAVFLILPDSVGLPVVYLLYTLWCSIAGYALADRLNRRA